uniref:Metallophos domain-containing protein n=1 Tax=Schistocephalus solidus TaxID=70667 RepID=A0A183TTX9_SCHSO
LLHLYHDAGVRFIFSGHLHRNGGGLWAPSDGSPTLEVISSSAVGVQLGSDSSGLRVVHVSAERGLTHKYFSFDDLESARLSSTGCRIVVFCTSTYLTSRPAVYRPFSTNATPRGLEFAVPLTTGKHVKPRPTRPVAPVKTDSDFKGESEFRVAAYGISQMIEIARLAPADLIAKDYHNIKLPPDVSSEVLFFSRTAASDPTSHRDILVFRCVPPETLTFCPP